jgi:hypothetical protein
MINAIVNKNRNLTTFVCTGAITSDDILDAVTAFYGGNPTLHIIWDFTAVDLSKLTGDEIRAIAKKAKGLDHSRDGGRTALVASEDAAFGLGRMYEIFAEITELTAAIRVVRTMEDANQWIDS